MKDRKRIELLAPAGSFEALKAAAANGADAVYLGGDRFNARKSASNFPDDVLRKALDYAGERGIKVYVTLNTLIKDNEMDEALQFAGFVYKEGADAVIVQDIGLASTLHRCLPDLKLHASTQMTIMNSDGIRLCHEMGIKRAVPARELSLDEIKIMTGLNLAEIEIFIHGALCVCYSGQCLMSGYIGGRSGNRGSCAQPCRLPWSISSDGVNWSDESYLLSTRDLMGLSELPGINRAGVSSLKIEGRMKSPEYVAVVTSVYRKYLDRLDSYGEDGYAVEPGDIRKLMQIFNRGGFTSSYLKGSRNYRELIYPNHPKNRGVSLGTVADSRRDAVKVLLEKPLEMGDGIEVWDTRRGVPDIIVSSIVLNGNHVRYAPAQSAPWVGDMKTAVEKGSEVWRTYSKALMSDARASFENGEKRLVPLKALFEIHIGMPAKLTISDQDGNTVSAISEMSAEKAEKRALSKERIVDQINKTGDTPYVMNSVKVEADGLSTVPVSALNAMRREVLEAMGQCRISRAKRELNWVAIPKSLQGTNQPKREALLSAFFFMKPEISPRLNDKVRRIYVPPVCRNEAVNLRNQFAGEIYVWTPNTVKDEEMSELITDLHGIEDIIDGVSAANPGTINMLRSEFPTLAIHADSGMNIFNSASIGRVAEWGVKSATVSPELRNIEAGHLNTAAETEVIVYGRIPLMTLESCPAGAKTGCGGNCGSCTRHNGFLMDRKGTVFQYTRPGRFRRTQLMTPIPIFNDELEQMAESGVSLFRLVFSDEDRDTAAALSDWFYSKLKSLAPGLLENERRIIEGIKEKSGRGYWDRGV